MSREEIAKKSARQALMRPQADQDQEVMELQINFGIKIKKTHISCSGRQKDLTESSSNPHGSREEKMDAWVTWQMWPPRIPNNPESVWATVIHSLKSTVWWIWKGLKSSVLGHSQHTQQEPEAQEWDLMGMKHLNKWQHDGEGVKMTKQRGK